MPWLLSGSRQDPARVRRWATAAAVLGLAAAVSPLSAGPAQAGIGCGTLLPLGDCTPPESTITDKPPTSTSASAARFDFTTVSPETGATFKCKLEGPSAAHDYSDCTLTGSSPAAGSKLYTDLVDGTYTFSVVATDNAFGSKNTETTPETYTWEISTVAPPDGDPPNTTITSRIPIYYKFPFIGIEYTSNEEALGFKCHMDGRARSCDDDQFEVTGMSAGDHTFKVAAVDTSGNTDPTPATVRWAVPQDDGAFKRSTGAKAWKRDMGVGYFRDTFISTTVKGATLRRAYDTKVTEVALLVTKCPSCGTMKVTLNDKPLRAINLYSATPRKKVVVPLKTWRTPHKGVFKFIVTSSGKKILVDGIFYTRIKR